MKITAVLPVSRLKYLDLVLDSLKNQTYKNFQLIAIFDGNPSDYLEARNKIIELPFETYFVQSNNRMTANDIFDRRRNISNIHNQLRGLVDDYDWIFSIEDDGILPLDALEKLVDTVVKVDNVGMVTGIELGRWGSPYVGAWIVDDVNKARSIESVPNQYPLDCVQPIDACGLYCALIKAEQYKKHEFFTGNGLGPDVNLGISLRQQGYDNYIDWTIPVTHLGFLDGREMQITPEDKSRVVKFIHLYGSTWSLVS